MNKHSLKAHKTFNSRIEKKVIIGGKTDYCAKRMGYFKGENGITPALTFSRTSTLIIIPDVHMAEWMPSRLCCPCLCAPRQP